jgi:hypothetical protein
MVAGGVGWRLRGYPQPDRTHTGAHVQRRREAAVHERQGLRLAVHREVDVAQHGVLCVRLAFGIGDFVIPVGVDERHHLGCHEHAGGQVDL